jgi:hypothetical protein
MEPTMSLLPRLFLVSAAAGAGLLTYAALAGPIGKTGMDERSSAVVRIGSDDAGPVRIARKDGESVSVEAPYTQVEVGRRTRVEAPFASVDVNPDRRSVRVQAPFADVNVRW